MATKNRTTEEEIIEFYKLNHGLTIRKEDLVRPSKDFVLNTFVRIFESFDIFNLSQPDILACTDGSAQLPEDAVLTVNVFHVTQKIVNSVGLEDFKMSDLLEPKRARTNRILHAFANFYIRYHTIKAEWFEHAEKFTKLSQAKKELEKRNTELKFSIEDKSILLSSLKNKSVALEKEIKASEEKFSYKKREAEKEDQKASEIKTEIAKLKEKLCGIKLEGSELIESNKKLSELIISSPMKMIEATNEFEQKLESLKKTLPELKATHNNIASRKTGFASSEKLLTDGMLEMKELYELELKFKEKRAEYDEIIKNSQHYVEEMKQMEIEKKNIDQSIQSLTGIIKKENAKFERDKQVFDQLLEGFKSKIQSLEQSSTEHDGSNKVILDKINKLEEELKELSSREEILKKRQLNEHRLRIEKILQMNKLFEKLN